MADYYRDVIRLLRDAGFEFRRQGRGDHEMWWHPKTGISVVVDRKLRSRFTANGILKEAGLPKSL
ncbi:MAG: type II toxin-antitoxin system HicA family toxin [Pseudolabrys sp.]|nr:type II toxin-antitoxin system HicA family toxin [Pseudolabrys sp.]